MSRATTSPPAPIHTTHITPNTTLLSSPTTHLQHFHSPWLSSWRFPSTHLHPLASKASTVPEQPRNNAPSPHPATHDSLRHTHQTSPLPTSLFHSDASSGRACHTTPLAVSLRHSDASSDCACYSLCHSDASSNRAQHTTPLAISLRHSDASCDCACHSLCHSDASSNRRHHTTPLAISLRHSDTSSIRSCH
ncbi:hypothetical protein Pcinc_001225 [Petrolisthes cinctipes]|uniref:Uncharacterized protein n=1 Tax=Petrolisthes cinctipes TaxID=88211 RepID=A0AAE1L4S0_PETCI|nr:hypothetical protein Pcinc_001225 [Petrolisthes cinctipes]